MDAPAVVRKCHQRIRREELAALDPQPTVSTLDGCVVWPVEPALITDFIIVNEWLQSMPAMPRAAFALFTPDGRIMGANVFGHGNGTAARNVCGEEHARLAVCLERGACAHWAHPHAGSFLTAAACREAARLFGWRIFYAYSDVEAGEQGTIYQACNWHYLGQAPGREPKYRMIYTDPSGKDVSTRTLRRAHGAGLDALWPSLAAQGWTRRRHPEKHKYVHFQGDRRERHALLKALKYPVLPYPKHLRLPSADER